MISHAYQPSKDTCQNFMTFWCLVHELQWFKWRYSWYSQNNGFETISCLDLPLLLDEKKHSANSEMAWKLLHGEKFGGFARPTRRTDALSTWRAAPPLFGRTAQSIWGNHYPKLAEPLREILRPAVLSEALSSAGGNQCPNFRVHVTLNQRGAAFPPLVQRFY